MSLIAFLGDIGVVTRDSEYSTSTYSTVKKHENWVERREGRLFGPCTGEGTVTSGNRLTTVTTLFYALGSIRPIATTSLHIGCK